MKIKLKDGTLLQFPNRPLTLGDQRLLKREFGVVPGRDGFDLEDPDHVAALLFAAMRQDDPDTPAKALLARIERITEMDIVGDDGEPLEDVSPDDVPDPTPEPTSVGAAASE